MISYEYTYQKSELSSAITEWAFDAHQVCKTYVLPDGCCDVIVSECSHQRPTWFLSELGRSAYTVSTSAGMRIRGVRLRPGVNIRQAELYAWLRGRNPAEIFVSDQLNEFCTESENLSVALDCIASGQQRTLLCVAKELGVSLRTLERFVKSGTGESPYFWFSLARARKAGRSLYEIESLSDAAFEAGFADQSHMSREMKKWFKRTPAQIRADKNILSILSEPGYG